MQKWQKIKKNFDQRSQCQGHVFRLKYTTADIHKEYLDHLESGEVSLPPQVLLHVRAQCCQEIV